MYDWIKMVTYNYFTKTSLLNNPELNFTTDVNPDTGEIKPINCFGTFRRVAHDHGLTFNIYDNSGRIEIKGSLHQFYNSVINGKGYNYNLFTLNNSIHVIELLRSMYGVIPKETSVHNLETGVNIKPCLDINVKKQLDYIKAFKDKKFNSMDIRIEGKGKKVVFNQYKVKVYDKGAHQKCNDDILRYEIGYYKMQMLGYNLRLSDLIKVEVWKDLSTKLTSSIDNILFTDIFDKKALTKTEFALFNFCNNADEWELAERTKRSRSKILFNNLIRVKGKYKFSDIFKELAEEQIRLMIQ